MTTMRKSLLALTPAGVLTAGTLWAPDSEAAQGLCFRCVFVWFNGQLCQIGGHEGPQCFEFPTGCYIPVGECNTLTVIQE